MADNFFEQKRPWSKYKDFILDYYLTPYIAKVQYLRRPILIVDCCAGPGRFEDETEGSPLIIAKHLEKWKEKGVRVKGIFLEENAKYFKQLENELDRYSDFAEPIQRDYTTYLGKIARMAKSHTVFLYVDPYGIKALPFTELAKIYGLIGKQGASIEVLMNFNSPALVRCGLAALKKEMQLDPEYTDEFFEEPVSEFYGLIPEQVDSIAGGDYWRKILSDDSLDFIEQEKWITAYYKRQMTNYFRMVCSYPVKERYRHSIPKYRLIYGTRHPHGILLMNDAMYEARERFLSSEFADGRLFDTRPLEELKDFNRFAKKLYEIVKKHEPISREDLILNAMRWFFCHYKKSDYINTIRQLLEGAYGLKIYSNSGSKRINDKTLLSTKPF